MGSEDDLCVRIETLYQSDELLLPVDVQAYLGFVHEEDVRQLVLHESREQDEQHLLLTAGEHVGREPFLPLEEENLVAVTVDALARLGKETVEDVLELLLLARYLLRLALCVGVSLREEGHDALALVDLVVKIAPLQEVELHIEFGGNLHLHNLVHDLAAHDRAVETAYDIKAHAVTTVRSEGQLHTARLTLRLADFQQAAYHTVEDGTLAYPIHTAQDVDARTEVPHDVPVPVPQGINLDTRYVISQSCHGFILFCFGKSSDYNCKMQIISYLCTMIQALAEQRRLLQREFEHEKEEFQRQMAADPTKRLRVALIYSYGANEEEADGILDEENSEDTSALDSNSRDFLERAIADYNAMFHTNYSTDGDKFQNYYKDVSLRMKNKELDLLIVVNMFLTGFDATTLNTLWVDKNLKMHGLIQAYSRTNRILNSIKTFGNIVCFRNLQKRTDDAISLFGDKAAGGIGLLRGYKDYYFGYTDNNDKEHPGYVDMIDELVTKFPLIEERITGEQRQKEFIVLFGAILRMRNLLASFDEFAGNEILSERDLQDYLGRYQDLRDEWRNRQPKGDKEDIIDDIVFEIELIKQIEINIDYILMLVKKYHDSHCDDKEVLITIQKAIDASPELRSKKALIENFIAGINDVSDVMVEWRQYVAAEKERQLVQLIQEENLKEEETRKFIEVAFRDGSVKTTGTDIDKLMPPMSRFGGGNRAEKKQGVIAKLLTFFERFFGIG